MPATFQVIVNRTNNYQIANQAEVDRLCTNLAKLPVYTVTVVGESGYRGATLDLIIESGRALVFFLDLERKIKLSSRNETCTRRGIVSLRNDAYPELELDQIEVHHRDLFSPQQAISILHHYLMTEETINLVSWPPNDWEEWGDCELKPDPSGEDIPF
ncbi:MAG: hypothetical protein ACFCD0_11745 [Gemmataceae bacterium]